MRALLTALGLTLAGIGLAAADETPAPVVVELFTSQGCSSCPPADAFLGELARRPGVIALSLHVDYWDYIGWRDPFASAEMTARQHAYGRVLNTPMVYTPQMVIDGATEAVGSDRAQVLERIAAARDQAGPGKVAVELVPDGAGAWRAVIGAAAQPLSQPATVWLVMFDRESSADVARGENAGRNLPTYNVVREMRRLGTWDGSASEIPIRPDLGNGCAVILQAGDVGPILGAAMMTAAKEY
jgi:hypothetical protein